MVQGIPVLGYFFLVHCTRIDLCCSNFPLLVMQKNAAAAAPQNNEELGPGIRPNPNPPGYHASIHTVLVSTT